MRNDFPTAEAEPGGSAVVGHVQPERDIQEGVQEAAGEGRQVWSIRRFLGDDQAAVVGLYSSGLLLGRVDPWDTASDLDYMEEAYFSQPRDNFLVAEVDGLVVGMIGVVEDESQVAHIRRLRVDPRWQETELTGHLVEAVLDHCRQMGFLKVVLDTHMDPQAATALISNCGFQHARQKNTNGKVILEFYLNLYYKPLEC